MSPDLVAGILKILESIGALPLTALLALLIIGPWLMSAFLARAQERRFEAVAKMYRDNVELVVKTQQICERGEAREADLRGLIESNTRAITQLTDVVNALKR